jgi:putative nucleotidyltransferase with HDIG domain
MAFMADEGRHIPAFSRYSYDTNLIARSISAGLSVIDKRMNIVWINAAQEKWFGRVEELRGRRCYEVYENRDMVCAGCPVAKVFKFGYSHCTSIRRNIPTLERGKRCFKLTASPIRDHQGKIVHVLELVEDVTDQRRGTSRRQSRLKRVEKRYESITELNRKFISSQELSFENMLRQSAEIAANLMAAKACIIKVADKALNILTTRAIAGLHKEPANGYSQKAGEWLSARVAAARQLVIIGDLKTSGCAKDEPLVSENHLRSAMGVPIMLKDNLLGTLCVYGRRSPAFRKDDADILSCFAGHLAVLIDNVQTHKEVYNSYLNTVESLIFAVEARDSYTRGHSEKVTKFSLDIANEIGLSDEDKAMLAYCGRLHDIGKIAVSDAILNKPGPLTAAERAEIQLHPIKAVEILSNLKFLERGIPAIRHHHERYDGTGYPDGLKGGDIPLLARILGCADAFDAMTSDRAYRMKMTIEGAVSELQKNRARQFDPDIIDAFLRTLGRKYCGK